MGDNVAKTPQQKIDAVVRRSASQPVLDLGPIRGTEPNSVVSQAVAVANELKKIIQTQKLSLKIRGKEHVYCEGWTTLAALLGCTAREKSNERQEDGSYVAVVELCQRSGGSVISSASAECGGSDDGDWKRRPANARRSMAATRATGKACRLAFSWVMTLAGYQATPAEEMLAISDEPATDEQIEALQDVINDDSVAPEEAGWIVDQINSGVTRAKADKILKRARERLNAT